MGGGGASGDYHCVTHVDPNTWTLVRPGTATQRWGYLVLPDGHAPAPGLAVADGARHVDCAAYITDPPLPAAIFRNGYRPSWSSAAQGHSKVTRHRLRLLSRSSQPLHNAHPDLIWSFHWTPRRWNQL